MLFDERIDPDLPRDQWRRRPPRVRFSPIFSPTRSSSRAAGGSVDSMRERAAPAALVIEVARHRRRHDERRDRRSRLTPFGQVDAQLTRAGARAPVSGCRSPRRSSSCMAANSRSHSQRAWARRWRSSFPLSAPHVHELPRPRSAHRERPMADMQLDHAAAYARRRAARPFARLGRIVSVTGSKAIVLLDGPAMAARTRRGGRPDMGTLLAIDTANTVVLAIVSALSVPVPATATARPRSGSPSSASSASCGDGRGRPGRRSSARRHLLSLRSATACASPPRTSWQLAFCGDAERSVRIGCIRQDSSIPAMVRVDELLGKHFAILGTTGTGKSCTTALILRAILEKNPAAHIVLLDPHNEYADRLPRMGRGHQPAQHATAVLAPQLRGDRRGADRRSERARPRSRSCRS